MKNWAPSQIDFQLLIAHIRCIRKSVCVAKPKIKLMRGAGRPIVAQAGFQHPTVLAIWAGDDIGANGPIAQGDLAGVLRISKSIAAQPSLRKYTRFEGVEFVNGRESLRQSGLVLRDGRQCQPMIEAQ